MKVEELRLLIQEVVRETMREELSSILTEAVKIASTPEERVVAGPTHLNLTTPAWVQELNNKPQVAESKGKGVKSPVDMLMSTAQSVSRAELQNFM